MPYDVKRLWKFPFLMLWIGELFLLVHRTGEVLRRGALFPDPSSGRIYSFTQDKVYFLTADQHASLIYFGVGMGVFVICYLISAYTTAGAWGFFRILPIDGKDIDPTNRKFAFILTTVGALACIAAIAYSYIIY